jgi:hypothetical protein
MAEFPTSPMIKRALKTRPPRDIAVVFCSSCGALTYYNQGSHCTCEACDADLDHMLDPDVGEVTTLDDVWDAMIDREDGP